MLRWSESCIWGHLDTTVQGRRLGAGSAVEQGCSQQTLHGSCIPSLNDCGISLLPGKTSGGELPVPAGTGTSGGSGKIAVTTSPLPRL